MNNAVAHEILAVPTYFFLQLPIWDLIKITKLCVTFVTESNVLQSFIQVTFNSSWA